MMLLMGGAPALPPVNTVAPVVSGTAQVGQTLSTTNGTWTGTPPITYTYQWQRSGSNIGGATSSTYVIQFADEGYTLRCVVTATNSVSAVSANSNSTGSVADMAPGTAYGGGYYAGKISVNANGVATHRLVVSPKASGAATRQQKTSASDTPGTDSRIDGPGNSAVMNNASHPAAQFCENLSINGYTDWYLPAMDEWTTIYYFLKPTTDSNNTSFGSTAYAVSPQPINTNYSTSSPAQTASTLFQSSGAETLYDPGGDEIWSSTQYSAINTRAYALGADNGRFATLGKDYTRNVRAIRRVPI